MKMTRKLLLPLLFCSILILSACNIFAPPVPPEMSAEDYLVVKAVMDSVMNDQDSILMLSETSRSFSTSEIGRYLLSEGIIVESSMPRRYKDLNAEPNEIDANYLPKNIIWLEPDTLDLYWENGNLRELYTRHELSSITFISRPCISSDGKAAIMEFEFFGGPLSASGSAVYLKKQNDIWKIFRFLTYWIS